MAGSIPVLTTTDGRTERFEIIRDGTGLPLRGRLAKATDPHGNAIQILYAQAATLSDRE